MSTNCAAFVVSCVFFAKTVPLFDKFLACFEFSRNSYLYQYFIFVTFSVKTQVCVQDISRMKLTLQYSVLIHCPNIYLSDKCIIIWYIAYIFLTRYLTQIKNKESLIILIKNYLKNNNRTYTIKNREREKERERERKRERDNRNITIYIYGKLIKL